MLCFRTYGGFTAGQYDGGDPYIEGTKMKKIDFEFIKKADFVLVFILAVLGIILLCVTILQEIIPYHGSRQNNRIAVVDDEKIEIKEYIEFDLKIRDAYIFTVKSSGIRVEVYEAEKMNKSSAYFDALGKGGNEDGITNFLFVKTGGDAEYTLFPRNTFIYKYRLAAEDTSGYRYPCDCNVYAVVKEDTNNDKILDGKDDIALYISDYDGKNLNEISASIDTFAFIDKNQFLFTEYNGTDSTYYAYDCAERKKYTIKSGVKEKSAGKLIVLY